MLKFTERLYMVPISLLYLGITVFVGEEQEKPLLNFILLVVAVYQISLYFGVILGSSHKRHT